MQVVVNSQVRLLVKVDGENLAPPQATLVNFGGGTIVLLAICFALRLGWPSIAEATAAPWWVWTGGLFGIVYVTSSVILGPRLGLTLFIILVIAGQIATSIVIDHFGFLGAPVKPLNLGRMIGAAVVFLGAVLVANSTEIATSASPTTNDPPTIESGLPE